MIKKVDIINYDRAADILKIQIPSYKIEAALIDYDGIPALKDTVETLQKSGEQFYGYYVNGKLCGAISYKKLNGTADIHRLIVHPDRFREGIASELLKFLEENEEKIETITVSTSSKNAPAVKFYLKNNFAICGKTKVDENVTLINFEKKLNVT